MVSLQACTTLGSTTNLLLSSQKSRVMSINRPMTYLKKPMIVVPKLPNVDITKNVVIEEFNGVKTSNPFRNSSPKNVQKNRDDEIMKKLYAVLESIYDRIEMHNNVKEQRVEWNSLLLNSINMITLTGATMAGISTMDDGNLALKLSSMVLFMAATGLVVIMNKIQPSQLAQEQRNAVRLFKQLKNKIELKMSMTNNLTGKDVEGYVEEVLALDRAYPLPLLGAMLEKFPETYKPANWWPSKGSSSSYVVLNKTIENEKTRVAGSGNGWSKKLESEMRDVVDVIEKKDIPDYVRLGNKALKLNKTLAVMGPLLTGIAVVGSSISVHGAGWGGVVAAVAGSMASVVNAMEHGGQVGMVFEMYRNCGGLFSQMVENVESTLEEVDYEKRENGELFEIKLALKLGRSLSEIRDLANKLRENKGVVNEFVSKLF
ncbi:hypothetical protein RND81_07G121400 [Saponaria officinalis]|uniref:F-box protein n=1 Tax=Saponaria officinalis TaxID=3572 RepID=A0AAW1JMN2_SAPOF